MENRIRQFKSAPFQAKQICYKHSFSVSCLLRYSRLFILAMFLLIAFLIKGICTLLLYISTSEWVVLTSFAGEYQFLGNLTSFYVNVKEKGCKQKIKVYT